MQNRSFLLLTISLVLMTGILKAQTPTVIQCTVNAKASRSFADDIGWYGPLPDRDGVQFRQPDKAQPFRVVVPNEETDINDILFDGFIFSQLDTQNPHVRLVPFEKDSTGKPVPGYERDATVIQRTPDALFFVWEGVPAREVYTVVLHLKSLKAAIGRTSFSEIFPGVSIGGMTADCQ